MTLERGHPKTAGSQKLRPPRGSTGAGALGGDEGECSREGALVIELRTSKRREQGWLWPSGRARGWQARGPSPSPAGPERQRGGETREPAVCAPVGTGHLLPSSPPQDTARRWPSASQEESPRLTTLSPWRQTSSPGLCENVFVEAPALQSFVTAAQPKVDLVTDLGTPLPTGTEWHRHLPPAVEHTLR